MKSKNLDKREVSSRNKVRSSGRISRQE